MSVKLEEKPAIVRSAVGSDRRPPMTINTGMPLNHTNKIRDLWALRHLLRMMVKRDLLGRYRGSVMGFFWTIINPLGHLLLYTFVFSVILKVRFGADGSTSSFALYLMTGLLPWGAFSEALSRAPSTIAEQPNLVKRVVFPLEILPLSVVISAMLSEAIGLSILLCLVGVVTHTVHWTIVFVPLIMASQGLFIAGMSWILASLGVYIHDLRHLIALTLSTWMYATPIVYPATAFPDNLKWLFWINPAAGMVTDFRRIILEGRPPDWTSFATYTAVGLVIFLVGHFFFCKTKRSFADVV